MASAQEMLEGKSGAVVIAKDVPVIVI